MKTTQHTPGPWQMLEKDWSWPVVMDSKGEFMIAKVDTSLNGTVKSLPEATANARLIAAAPELLDALEDLENALTHDGDCQCCPGSNEQGHDERCPLLKARAAIAKAKGEA